MVRLEFLVLKLERNDIAGLVLFGLGFCFFLIHQKEVTLKVTF